MRIVLKKKKERKRHFVYLVLDPGPLPIAPLCILAFKFVYDIS